MSASKFAIQIGHGTDFIHLYSQWPYTNPEYETPYKEWLATNRRKIILKVKSEEKLKNLMKLLDEKEIDHSLIYDKGYTELDSETLTGLVIHPIDEEKLPKNIRRLRLM